MGPITAYRSGPPWRYAAPRRCGRPMRMDPDMPLSNAARRIDTEALKRERPLADLVASYGIALRRESAGTHRALCPIHQERTPSFWIDGRDGSNEHYWCFGCSAHGDVITFVMEREGCSFQEACERLSARGRPPVVEPAPRASTKPTGRHWEELSADSIEARTLDLALQVYEKELWRDTRAQGYLRRRAVPEEVARTRRLGYADGHALLGWLRRESGAELLQVAVELGLVLERPGAEDGTSVYREFFQDRLIVPELRQGRPIWYIGRTVEDEAPPVGNLKDGTPVPAAGSAATTSSAVPVRRPRPK